MIYIINLRDVARPSTTLQSQLAPAKMELLLQVDASTVGRLRHSGRSTEATAWAPTMWGIRISPLLLFDFGGIGNTLANVAEEGNIFL